MDKVNGLFGTIKNSFSKLTKREQVMIYGLVILAVLAIMIFLIILPAITHMSELNEEVTQYKAQEMDTRLVISQSDAFDKEYKSASKSFNALKKQFYMPMDPESLDETITTLIVQSGLSPKDLTMTTLQQGKIPKYVIQPLASAGIAAPTTSGEAADTSGEADAEATDGSGTANSEEGTDAYIYTVTAIAEGDQAQISKLVDLINATSGIELNSYKLSLSNEESEPGTVTMGGTVDMEFYVYVYVDKAGGVTYPAMGADENQN